MNWKHKDVLAENGAVQVSGVKTLSSSNRSGSKKTNKKKQIRFYLQLPSSPHVHPWAGFLATLPTHLFHCELRVLLVPIRVVMWGSQAASAWSLSRALGTGPSIAQVMVGGLVVSK